MLVCSKRARFESSRGVSRIFFSGGGMENYGEAAGGGLKAAHLLCPPPSQPCFRISRVGMRQGRGRLHQEDSGMEGGAETLKTPPSMLRDQQDFVYLGEMQK